MTEIKNGRTTEQPFQLCRDKRCVRHTLNILQQITTAENQLAFYLGETSVSYQIEEEFDLNTVAEKQELLEMTMKQNTTILAARRNLEKSEIQKDISLANKYPTISLSTGYSYANNQSAAGFLQENRSNGLNAAISLRYTLFDGNKSNILRQNATIDWQNNQLNEADIKIQVANQFQSLYADYTTNKSLHQLSYNSLEANEMNFSRSSDLYRTGQLNGTQFREAQLNLLQAQQQVIFTKIQAQLAAYQLIRLSGELVVD